MAKDFIDSKIQKFSNLVRLDVDYFISGGLWLTLSILFAGLGGIALSSLFARLWPKDVYGQYSFLVSALSFLSIFSLTGMQEAVFQGSIENKDGIFKEAARRVFVASILGTVILVLGSIYFYSRDNPNLALAVLLSSIAFPFSALGGLSVSFYKGKKNFRLVAIMSIGANLFSILMTAVALIWFRSFVVVALFSTWSTAFINILLVFKTLKDPKNNISDRKLLKYGFFASLTGFIWQGLDYADRFFIPLLLGFEKFAIYSFSIFIPNQIQAFFKSLVTLGQPKITEISDRNIKKALVTKSLYLEFLILIIVILYFFASPYVYRVLYPDYEESIFLSQLFAFSLLYYPSNLFGTYLTKKRLIRESVIGTLVFAVFSFGSLLLFIYLWGLIGAVISKIFSRILQVVITQFIFFRELRKEATAISTNL